MEGDAHGGIVVLPHAEVALDQDGGVEFLADLALQGDGGRLAGVDFTAGKFPKVAEVFVGWAAADERASGALGQRADDR